jgi:REP element-mobilizing transposase RayT
MSIVRDDFDRRRWVSLRRDSFGRVDVGTYAWCLMGNHFHMIVEGALADISKALHRLNGVYAQRFNSRHIRTGHLYEQRPGIRVIGDDEYLENGCDYLRANPVRAGLCEKPDDWPWAGGDFYASEPLRCTAARAGAHEQSGETSPSRPFSWR